MLTLSANANGDVVAKDATAAQEVEGAKYISNAELATKLKKVQKSLKKAEKKIKKLDKKLNIVKAHDAFDNIKFSVDFRNSIDNINYKYNKYSFKGESWDGREASNDSLLATRLYLNMKSKPMDKLTFLG